MSVSDRAQTTPAEGPAHRLLGLEFVSRSAEHGELRMPVRPEHLQVEGVVHGGLITTLADQAAVTCLHAEMAPDQTMTSIELKVSFLRPALLGAGDLVARADVIKRGRSVALCRVEVTQGEKAVARGLFTYLFSDRG